MIHATAGRIILIANLLLVAEYAPATEASGTNSGTAQASTSAQRRNVAANASVTSIKAGSSSANDARVTAGDNSYGFNSARPQSISTRSGSDSPSGNAPVARRPLDLRAPDITTILTPAQIQQILTKTFDSSIEEIEVQGDRTKVIPNTPDIPAGIFAPFWALAHPTQAWRIFLPLPPDQAQRVGAEPFDATDPNLPPVLPPQP